MGSISDTTLNRYFATVYAVLLMALERYQYVICIQMNLSYGVSCVIVSC